MALKDIWVNKVDGEDYVEAKDINDIAEAVMELENQSKLIPISQEEYDALVEAGAVDDNVIYVITEGGEE